MENFIQTNYLPKDYLVNKYGDIKSPKGKILKKSISNSGYYFVNIRNKSYFTHRAIAFAFIPHVKGKDFVNHKNGIKTDISLKNLEWNTQSENIKHAYSMGLKKYKPLHYKGKFGKDHNRSMSVICVETGVIYGSQSEASRKLNLGSGSVSWSIKHKRPIFGMHFEFKELK
jgi:hypothetical protein